jgi:hypothetical protein
MDRIEITAAGARLLRRDPQTLIKAAVSSLSSSERRALLAAVKRASTALSRRAFRLSAMPGAFQRNRWGDSCPASMPSFVSSVGSTCFLSNAAAKRDMAGDVWMP